MTTQDAGIPCSLLDTDLYKLTMQAAVLECFPDGAQVAYKFTNRHPSQVFSRQTAVWVYDQVQALAHLRLTADERRWLERSCPYFKSTYLDFLQGLELKPSKQVEVEFRAMTEEQIAELHDSKDVNLTDGEGGRGQVGEEIKNGQMRDRGAIELRISGDWCETILYEVPLMAILSEGYFRFDDTDWSDDDAAIEALAASKAQKLLERSDGSLAFSEFGTRRRRSLAAMDAVIRGLVRGDREYQGKHGGGLVGTSNVYFAKKYDLRPVGTIAHEWIMAYGAKSDYERPNGAAMDAWERGGSASILVMCADMVLVYPADATSPLHTMLTDTYTIHAFFNEFVGDSERALRWNALRHDSGDPIVFARAVKRAWEEVARRTGQDANELLASKRVIFSDSLDVDRALSIWEDCEKLGVKSSFGIGTHFTNDFQSTSGGRSRPLNIVIKLREIDGLACVKLTDDRGKYTGDRHEVERVAKKIGV